MTPLFPPWLTGEAMPTRQPVPAPAAPAGPVEAPPVDPATLEEVPAEAPVAEEAPAEGAELEIVQALAEGGRLEDEEGNLIADFSKLPENLRAAVQAALAELEAPVEQPTEPVTPEAPPAV